MPKVMWKYEISKRYDRSLIWLSYHMPKRLVMWCTIRVINHACSGEYRNQEVPALRALEALDRWHTR
jgi:hypothetical protein